MNASLLKSAFEQSLPYDRYLESDPGRAAAWRRAEKGVHLTELQKTLIKSFTRQMPVLVVSGVWCGDCAQQGPMIQAIAQASPMIELRWIDRDTRPDLVEHTRICDGARVPVAIWMAEDFEFVHMLGDRTLSRYRSIARSQLGPSCPMPGAALPADEAAETLQEWVNEFERVQLLLRLSARLRQKHGD
ncbi:MAG: thioredoxin family protein [Planctomycetes bacterium]|nr:thioredoxin family protein [Planctomycetota bacterium]